MKKIWKSVLCRGLLGGALGITVNQIVAIIISASMGGGAFYFTTLQVIAQYGSELNGAIVTTCLTALMGFCFGASSVIFSLERWSILKQTAVHFLVIVSAYFAAAYMLHWFAHDLSGFLCSLGIFIATYLGVWLGQYCRCAKKVKAINRELEEQ